MINSKSRLAIELSKLKVFKDPDIREEQYPTDSEIAAEILWNAYMNEEIEGKVMADLGSGTGILGIGCLLLGAELVYFIEKDPKAMEIAKENLNNIENKEKAILIKKDIEEFDEKVDVVVENPPFGTKQKHADKAFLEKAFNISKVIYTIHKSTSQDFIDKISKDNNFEVTNYTEHDLPIKASQLFHKRKIHRIKVGCWRLEKLKE